MEVYHGTIDICSRNILSNGISIAKGKPRVDFGQGFYTTPNRRFAESTALNKMEKNNLYKGEGFCKASVITYEFDEDMVKKNALKVLSFLEQNIEWAQFVINNRNGMKYVNNIKSVLHNINHTYDIVTGPIADYMIVNIASKLKKLNCLISQEEVGNILYQYKTLQISFHTEKSLNCIKLIKCDIM